MAFLLDTCVPSEITRRRPKDPATRWLSSQAWEALFTNRACIAELECGVAKLLADPKQLAAYTELFARTDRLKQAFSQRVLPVDEPVWQRWSELKGAGDATGRARPVSDTLLAATAQAHRHTVVTRNVRDFEGLCPILNPWKMPRP
jgi:toxin FitB